MVEVFWSKVPDYGRSREIDPLALSAVHDAAADVLLPFLSGRTRSADDYLWVLVGLRWACERAATDVEIWEQFERFEKALKLNWYHSRRRGGFAGIDAVREHYEADRTDLRFKLISNQRSQGLLGSYLRSLRDAGLVERRSLKLENLGRAFVDGVYFRWSGEVSHYGWLARTFGQAQVGFTPEKHHDLGKALFDPPQMRDTAAAIRKLGVKPAWRKAAPRLATSNGKQSVAHVGDQMCHFMRRMAADFWALLVNPLTTIPRLDAGLLRMRSWREVVFRSKALRPLRGPFDRFLSFAPRSPKSALIDLHQAVWEKRAHSSPWIYKSNGTIRVRPDIALKAPARESEWDLRWTVAYALIRQTRWTPE